MSKIALLLVLTLLPAGCALWPSASTTARDTWQGASYEDVVTRWGAPVRSTSFNDGRMVYTWSSSGVASRGSVWPSIGISGGSGFGVGIGVGVTAGASREVPVTCERTLIFKDHRVVEQAWEGPADFCETFRRQ